MNKQELKEQLQINVLQVFEDVNIMPNVDEKRDGTIALLEAMRHMCDVIVETVNKA